jgi:hypothetical protein
MYASSDTAVVSVQLFMARTDSITTPDERLDVLSEPLHVDGSERIAPLRSKQTDPLAVRHDQEQM